MTGKEIIILLKMVDITQTSIAKRLNLSQPAISHVIKGLRPSPKIRQAIAEAIGWPIEQIWPPIQQPTNNDNKTKHSTKSITKKQEGKIRP